MRLNLIAVLPILLAFGLYLSASARSIPVCVNEICKAEHQIREALPVPPIRPPPPVPKKPPGLKGKPSHPESGESSVQLPPSSTEYQHTGRKNLITLKNKGGNDNDHGWNTVKSEYKSTAEPMKSTTAFKELDSILQGINLKTTDTKWVRVTFSPKLGTNPLIESIHSTDKGVIIIAEMNKGRYPEDMLKDGTAVPLSELVMQGHLLAGGRANNINAVVVADIQAPEIRATLDDLRKFLEPETHEAGGIIFIDPTKSSREKAAFEAGAGLTVSKPAIYMAIDHKTAMGVTDVQMLLTYTPAPTGGSERHITWIYKR